MSASTWTKNGVAQSPIGAAWDYNQGNNTYWRITMPSFARGDAVSYTINANVNGTGQQSVGPFTFKVTSWSTVTNVASYVNNGTSVDVRLGNMSYDGCLLSSDHSFAIGEKVRLVLPRMGEIRAQVRWTLAGGKAGARFVLDEIVPEEPHSRLGL